MSRLMTLMLTGDSAPENLRLLSSRKLDHLAAHGATPALRTAAAELAVLARTAADRAETDPTCSTRSCPPKRPGGTAARISPTPSTSGAARSGRPTSWNWPAPLWATDQP